MRTELQVSFSLYLAGVQLIHPRTVGLVALVKVDLFSQTFRVVLVRVNVSCSCCWDIKSDTQVC